MTRTKIEVERGKKQKCLFFLFSKIIFRHFTKQKSLTEFEYFQTSFHKLCKYNSVFNYFYIYLKTYQFDNPKIPKITKISDLQHTTEHDLIR